MANMYAALSTLQQDALDRHLAAGQNQTPGFLLNAMLTGILETFTGKILTYENAGATTYTQLGLDKDLEPYFVFGSSQILSLRVSDTTAIAGAGLPDSLSGAKRGILRLTNNDTNAAAACAMIQENVLWIPNTNNWSLAWDIAQINQIDKASDIMFTEFGVVGVQTVIADITDSSKEPGDGNAFAAIKVYGNKAVLRVLPATGGTIVSSPAFEIPDRGAYSIRIDYQYNGGASVFNVIVNGRKATSLRTTLSGPLQLFARACHGANYAALTHSPLFFDIDGIIMSVPNG